jgi:steroid 5-alpha reductase family enzyme
MALLSLIGLAGLIVLGYMVILWIVSLILKNSSIVDIFWGLGFVVVGWAYFLLTDGPLARKLLIMALVTIWGLRLSTHILVRNWGKEEDFRYRQWRNEHGARWWWVSFFQVFLLQGFLLWVISMPLLVAQMGTSLLAGILGPVPQHLTVFDVIGAMLWTLGFFFEAVGDAHLARFIRNPANRGKLLTSGVWSYTRHPNYFGDAAQWWAYFLIAGAAGGWWTVFSPLLMTYLLTRVSGVAMLEKSLSKEKPGYAEYTARTNAFWPWLPRSEE